VSTPVRGERDLARLLATLSPELDPVRYAFCHLASRAVPAGLAPLALFHEAEGLTIVVPVEAANAAALPVTFRSRRIVLTVHSDFEAVGMMAAVATALAERQIPCNVMAAVFHDHLFVPEQKAGAAMDAIRALQAAHRDPIRLEWLADHPALVEQLAHWHHAEWQHLLPGWTVEQARADLARQARGPVIPSTIVALAGDRLLGSASLLERDIPGTEEWAPWLASVYVTPEWRGQGIGWRLVDRVMQEARELGVAVLHLFTAGAEGWYGPRGWRVIRRLTHAGLNASIMAFDLSRERGTFPQETAAGSSGEDTVTDWSERWQAILGDLERQRDELKVRLHLAKAEGREEWARIEEKLAALRLRAQSAGSEAKDAMKDIGGAADQLAAEIRQGLERVRKTL
jgi:hypothetical protein